MAWAAALVLVLHTLTVNILFHPFWSVPADLARKELSLFFKNVAVIGGLMIVASAVRPIKPA
ncbi:MAG: hypothetical protein AAFQ58_18400 [Pseudomonadota bacterium]